MEGIMLNEAMVYATVAVKDINKAKEFYGGTLGLEQVHDNPGGVGYKSGSGQLFVYTSQTAGSGQATCASWTVNNIEAVVDGLKQKGVAFEHYDLPGATMEGDIHVMGEMKAAWFKDPDGNILGLASG